MRTRRATFMLILVAALSLGCEHGKATQGTAATGSNYDAALLQAVKALAPYAHLESSSKGKGFTSNGYKLTGISEADAIAKVEPLLIQAGFKKHPFPGDDCIFNSPNKSGFANFSGVPSHGTDPAFVFFDVARTQEAVNLTPFPSVAK